VEPGRSRRRWQLAPSRWRRRSAPPAKIS
jgi:hypothetical protein